MKDHISLFTITVLVSILLIVAIFVWVELRHRKEVKAKAEAEALRLRRMAEMTEANDTHVRTIAELKKKPATDGAQ